MKSKPASTVFLCALLTLAALRSVTAQELVKNGGFESGDFTDWTSSGNFVFTTVVPTNTLYVHSGTYGAQLGPTNAIGFIFQDLATVPGQTYALSLWVDSPDGLGPNIFRVAWNGTNIYAQTNLPSLGWTNLIFPSLLATSNTTRLRLGFQDNPSYLGLDDISVTNTTPVSVSPIAYTFTTFAGFAGMGSADGVGGAAQFSFPTGIATDPAGNSYVADSQNYTIRKVTPAGVVTTIAGEQGFAGSDDGMGNAARFGYLGATALDNAGNIYVADTGNETIRKLTLTGTNWFVTTIAGQPNNGGTNDGIGPAIQFGQPTGVCVDSATNVYVADYSTFTIRKLSLIGTNWTSSTIAGMPGIQGTADGTNNASQFNSPSGLATDSSGNIYVAEYAAIRKITPVIFAHVASNWVVSTIAGDKSQAGTNNGTGTNAQFYFPQNLAIDPSTNIYVVENGNFDVRKIVPSGTNWVVSLLAGGKISSGSADGTGTNARFFLPYGISMDSAGELYITDSANNEIRQLTPDGIVTTLAGAATQAADVDGAGPAARFNFPQGVAVDNSGYVYVADTGNQTIRIITPAGVVTTPYGKATVGGTNDGVGENARFGMPEGIAVDEAGNLYVADTLNDTIRMIDRYGLVSTISGRPGQSGTNDGVGNAAMFAQPAGIAVDAATNLYVADTVNHTVRLLTRSGTNWTSSTIAGSPAVEFTNNGAGSGAGFLFINAIAVDAATNIYVVESSPVPHSGDVRELTKVGTNWVVSTIATGFDAPGGIAVDASGDIFVTEQDNTIQKLTLAGTGSIATTIGGTSFVSGSQDGTGGAAFFLGPQGIAADSAGNVYVADTDNNTIRKGVFTQFGSANLTTFTAPVMTGKLQVTLLPPAANGQWRFPWEVVWHDSGFTATNLAGGNYPVEFRNIPGWLAIPANLDAITNPAVVTAGTTAHITNYYYPTALPSDDATAGSLTVYLGANPPTGAGWRFLGDTNAFHPSNFTTNLVAGTYLIEFAGPFSGRATPSTASVQIFAGQPSLVSVSYPFAASPPAGVLLPVPVATNQINDLANHPFGFNGQLQSEIGFGSGVVVASNVVLTAAHLVFNDQTLGYVNGAYFFLQEDVPSYVPSPLIARGWYLLSGYAAQRSNDLAAGLVVDQSSPDSRNLDVAALYFTGAVADGGYAGYLPSDAVPNQWLTGDAEKMLVGYPVDGSAYGIASIVPGKMYEIGPQPYPLTLDSESVTNQQEDYLASWFLSFPGNSGGPLYVQLNGYFYPAGVFLGILNGQSVVRAIDSTVTNLIGLAATLGDAGTNTSGGGVITIVAANVSFANPGYLQIQLQPPSAVQAGAAWLLQPGTTYSTASNFTQAVFSTNAVALQFKPLPGWNLPTNQSIVVTPGLISTPSAFYTVLSPKLVVNSQGIGLSGTTNTTYRIEKTASLKNPVWTGLSTNTITNANFNLVVPRTNVTTMFYRAVWLNR